LFPGTPPPPIGVVTTYTQAGQTFKGIPYEYIVSVAKNIHSGSGIVAADLDVHELATVSSTSYYDNAQPWTVNHPSTDGFYRQGSPSMGTDGPNASDPIRYADDGPGVEMAPVEGDIRFNAPHETKSVWEAILTSNPVYKGKDVGKSESSTFTVTCTPVFSGTPSTITSFTWN